MDTPCPVLAVLLTARAMADNDDEDGEEKVDTDEEDAWLRPEIAKAEENVKEAEVTGAIEKEEEEEGDEVEGKGPKPVPDVNGAVTAAEEEEESEAGVR